MAIYMDYPQITTMEHLQTETSSSYGSVLKYEEHVLVTDLTFKGFTAAVYEFIETPEETGLGDIECRISRIAQADEYFKDGGSAVLWGFEQIKK